MSFARKGASLDTDFRAAELPRFAKAQSTLISIAAFAFLFIAWNGLISWNWARINSLCNLSSTDPVLAAKRDWNKWNWEKCETYFFGADPLEYDFYFQGFPASLRELTDRISDTRGRETLLVEYHKRPLFGPLSAFNNSIVAELFSLSHPARMHAVLAAYASICSILLYQLLLLIGSPLTLALCLTAVATVSFSWLSIFSMPESYSLSVAATIIAAKSGIRLMRAAVTASRWKILIHAVAIGLASWIYLPAFGAVFLAISPRSRAIPQLRLLLISGGIACALALAPQLMLGGLSQIKAQVDYGSQWGSFWNFLSLPNWIDVFAAFMIFSIVPPTDNALISPGSLQWTAMHFFPIIGSALLLGLLYFLLFLCALRRDIATTSIAGPAIWLLSLIAFHVGFNPREVLLYTSPPLVVALLIAALVLKQMQISTKQTLAGGLCLVGVLMLMNFRALA